MSISVVPWSRRHSRLKSRWADETNPILSALLLRADHEPYCVSPTSLAIVDVRGLCGVFSFRDCSDRSAFVGLALAPECRGAGLSVPAMRASLSFLAGLGFLVAWGSVAAPNRPALMMDFAAGFKLSGFEDWRSLPGDFNLSLLKGFRDRDYRLVPEPAILYRRVEVDLSNYVGMV